MRLFSWILVSFVFVTRLLASCGIKSPSMLDEIICPPPCWENIRPGVSTKQDVDSILPAINYVDESSIRIMSVIGANDSAYFDFNEKVKESGGRILYRDGKVAAVDIWPGNGILQLDEAVEKFGEPEDVLAIYARRERIVLSTFFLYPSRGIALLSIEMPFKGNYAPVEPDQQIDVFWYYEPKLFDELMTDGFITYYPIEFIRDGMTPWKGFGEYPYTRTDW